VNRWRRLAEKCADRIAARIGKYDEPSRWREVFDEEMPKWYLKARDQGWPLGVEKWAEHVDEVVKARKAERERQEGKKT
jgi:hypothetical protein